MPAEESSWPGALLHRLAGSLYRAECAIRALVGWRRAATAFLAGAASVLAMAPFFLWGVLFLTIPVLVLLIDSAVESAAKGITATSRPAVRRALYASAVGWWFGFGYFLAGLFWIGEAFLVEAERFAWLMPFAVTLMPAGLALFYAAATAAAAYLWRPGLERVVALALALSAAEWLRGHILTGFPWNVLGYALTWPLPLMQAAGLIGIYGLTLAVIPITALPLLALAEAASNPGWRRASLLIAALALLPLPIAWGYGLVRLAEPQPPPVEGVRLRLVQPSVPQRDKWLAERQRDIFFDHISLSRQGPDGRFDGLAGITHVVWPEASMPFLPLVRPDVLQVLGAMLPVGTHLLAGALRADGTSATEAEHRRVFNSLIALDSHGMPLAFCDKIQPVTIGEYLPLQPLLARLGLQKLVGWRGGFSAGRSPRQHLAVPGLPPIGALICYEAIFPSAVVQATTRPQALINLTNDGWFGVTTGPYQHFHQARVRAVEEGLPLIRVANNGISGVIDPNGRILSRLGLDERGVVDAQLPRRRTPPPYARFGDGLFAALWLGGLCILMLLLRRKVDSIRQRTNSDPHG